MKKKRVQYKMSEEVSIMKAYKVFDSEWTCSPDKNNPFQYEVGGTYKIIEENMALMGLVYCTRCGKEEQGNVYNHNWVCDDCKKKEEDEFLAEKRKLTLEQRIEAIELQLKNAPKHIDFRCGGIR